MDYQSKLGYSKGSPFNKEGSNHINAQGITMQNTAQPLIAANKKKAGQLRPGANYPALNGGVTEMTVPVLLEMEPVLLEAHLNTLKTKDKEVFMEKYQGLGTEMKVAALTQIFGKYPEVSQQVRMQNGGDTQFLGDLPKYEPEARGTLDYAPRPIQPLNYNEMFLNFAFPATNDAQRLDKQGRFDEASALRNDVFGANALRQELEQEDTTQFAPKMKAGGKAKPLSKAKAAEMLHDGTVHGKPITEKQRKFFAATAYGKKKQSGGSTDTGWKYEAPPTEGFHLVGIESNRPQKGELPAQGKRTPSVRKNAPLAKRTQDESTPEEEAFWARQRQMNEARMVQGNPVQGGMIQQLQNPSWLEGSKPGQVSNTSAAIATVAQDPVWDTLAPRRFTATDINQRTYSDPTTTLLTEDALRSRRENQIPLLTEDALRARKEGQKVKSAEAGPSNEYVKWKSYKSFSYPNKTLMDTDKTQLVKTFKNGDTLVKYFVFSPLDPTKLVPMHMVRDSRTGKYAQVDPTNVAEMKLLEKAK